MAIPFQRMAETTVRGRILLNFAIIVAMVVFARGFSHWVDSMRRDEIEQLRAEYHRGVQEFQAVIQNLNETAVILSHQIAGDGVRTRGQLEPTREEIRSSLQKLRGWASEPALLRSIDESLASYRELTISSDSFLSTLQDADQEGREAEVDDVVASLLDLWAGGTAFMEEMAQVIEEGTSALNRDINAVSSHCGNLSMANGVIHFFVILISVILVIRLSRSITRPIQSLTAGVEAFGEGNLAPAIGVTSKDEFGRLAKCFDELSHEIQRMISEGKRQADLALMVCSTLDTDEIARRLLNVVRQFLGGRQIALTMESVDGNGWVCFVSNEFDHVEKRQVDQLESGQLQADAPSLISIPLIAQEKVIGSLDIREHGAGADVERQINLVGSMLVSVSMALRNAQFFTELVHEKERVARQAEQLAAANTELEQTQRFKSRFLANMSHRLRTPLNSVIGCADLMESEVLGDLSDRQQQAVHSIRRSGHQLLGAIDHILNYSRLEGGELDMRWTEGHVGKVVEEALDRIRPLLTSSDKRFEPKVAIAPGAETWATDHVKLRYVLGCLLENAARSKEDAEVRVEIDKVDRGGEGWLRIAVIDNGRGIPNDRLRTIFEPFEGSEKELGSGLGLTLAKRLVDLLGGTIDVESQVGSGSTFTVVVPQHPA